jgi:hypothetical protein
MRGSTASASVAGVFYCRDGASKGMLGKASQPAMGIVIFIVLSVLIIVLVIRSRKDANSSQEKLQKKLEDLPQIASSKTRAKSPFNAGELTKRQKDIDQSRVHLCIWSSSISPLHTGLLVHLLLGPRSMSRIDQGKASPQTP